MGRKPNPENAAYSVPPKTELRLRELQEEYLKPDCPQSIKDDFFLLLRIYARSLTLKEIKRKGIFLPPERVDEISTDATLLLIKQYTKPGWRVLVSFGGTLYKKILEAMYGPASEDRAISLNTTFTNDQDSKEILDLISSRTCLPWQMNLNTESVEDSPEEILIQNMNASFSEIQDIIDEAYEGLPYNTFVKFLPWLVLQIRKPKTRNIQRLFNKLFLTGKEEDAFNILLLEIRNRILQHT